MAQRWQVGGSKQRCSMRRVPPSPLSQTQFPRAGLDLRNELSTGAAHAHGWAFGYPPPPPLWQPPGSGPNEPLPTFK